MDISVLSSRQKIYREMLEINDFIKQTDRKYCIPFHLSTKQRIFSTVHELFCVIDHILEQKAVTSDKREIKIKL